MSAIFLNLILLFIPLKKFRYEDNESVHLFKTEYDLFSERLKTQFTSQDLLSQDLSKDSQDRHDSMRICSLRMSKVLSVCLGYVSKEMVNAAAFPEAACNGRFTGLCAV